MIPLRCPLTPHHALRTCSNCTSSSTTFQSESVFLIPSASSTLAASRIAWDLSTPPRVEVRLLLPIFFAQPAGPPSSSKVPNNSATPSWFGSPPCARR